MFVVIKPLANAVFPVGLAKPTNVVNILAKRNGRIKIDGNAVFYQH